MTALTKFRNIVGRVEKLSKEELIVLLRDTLQEFNKEKAMEERPKYIENDYLTKDKDWLEVNKQVKRSKIKRISWNQLLGESLTKRTLKLRNKGFESDEVVEILLNHPKVKEFLVMFPKEKAGFIKNLKIGVSSRFAENKTADKLRKDR